jgi:hypothetical protein
MLQDVPPAEMEAMLLADAKIDDDALRQLANRRAQRSRTRSSRPAFRANVCS